MLFLCVLFSSVSPLPAAAQEKSAEEEFSRNYITQIQARNYNAVDEQTQPGLREDLRKNFEKVVSLFPAEKPLNVETVSSRTINVISSSQSKNRRTDLVLQYRFPGKWLLVIVALVKENNEKTLVADLHVRQIKDSLQTLNRFVFRGRGTGNYIFLVAASFAPLLIIHALVLCFKTPMPGKKKWLWIIFILFGLFSVTLNWNAETIYFVPFYFHLLGSGFYKGIYSPFNGHDIPSSGRPDFLI